MNAALVWTLHPHSSPGGSDAEGADFQNLTEVLRRFSSTESLAVRSYMCFLAEGLDESSLHIAGSLDETASFKVQGSEKGWPAVIGDPEFVRRAMLNHEVGVRRRYRQADHDQVLRNLTDSVWSVYGISRDDL